MTEAERAYHLSVALRVARCELRDGEAEALLDGLAGGLECEPKPRWRSEEYRQRRMVEARQKRAQLKGES